MLHSMRSLLYVPGNRRNMIQKAPSYGADVLVLDLEDSVPPSEKAAARQIVAQAIGGGELNGSRVAVRINGTATTDCILDLEAVVRPGLHGLRIPKVESASEVRELDGTVRALEQRAGMPEGSVLFLPTVESPLALLRAYEVASASPRIAGISFGAEDLLVALGVERSPEGVELQYARGHLVMCAAAAEVVAIDTMYPNHQDEQGLIAEARLAKQMGFRGKSAIHPRQIPAIHRVFAPSPEEVERARRIVEAFERAEAQGSGAVSVDGRMVDLPVVARARRTLALADGAG